MMKLPKYRWVCHKCGSSNKANTEVCATCGFPAVASGEDLEKSNPDYDPEKEEKARSQATERFLLFFPEGILGAILVLVAPFWAISLSTSGHLGAALLLVVGVATSIYLFVISMRKGHKYIAYLVTVGALILAYVINSGSQ